MDTALSVPVGGPDGLRSAKAHSELFPTGAKYGAPGPCSGSLIEQQIGESRCISWLKMRAGIFKELLYRLYEKGVITGDLLISYSWWSIKRSLEFKIYTDEANESCRFW